jgi:hypothetical protein
MNENLSKQELSNLSMEDLKELLFKYQKQKKINKNISYSNERNQRQEEFDDWYNRNVLNQENDTFFETDNRKKERLDTIIQNIKSIIREREQYNKINNEYVSDTDVSDSD